ncbi:MAG TPA: GNAT family N-acetyltransferase [Solirubrobacterales bacterium]
MPYLLVAPTTALDQMTLASIRRLLGEVFPGEFSNHDWEHALGGMHVLLLEGVEPIGHAAVVQRRLLHRGRALRAGYVEGLGVHANRRGQGHASTLMAAVEEILRSQHDLGALSPSESAMPFYAARNWRAWRGPLSALSPQGLKVMSPGAVYVFEHLIPLDPFDELTCDWRNGSLW